MTKAKDDGRPQRSESPHLYVTPEDGGSGKGQFLWGSSISSIIGWLYRQEYRKP